MYDGHGDVNKSHIKCTKTLRPEQLCETCVAISIIYPDCGIIEDVYSTAQRKTFTPDGILTHTCAMQLKPWESELALIWEDRYTDVVVTAPMSSTPDGKKPEVVGTGPCERVKLEGYACKNCLYYYCMEKGFLDLMKQFFDSYGRKKSFAVVEGGLVS